MAYQTNSWMSVSEDGGDYDLFSNIYQEKNLSTFKHDNTENFFAEDIQMQPNMLDVASTSEDISMADLETNQFFPNFAPSPMQNDFISNFGYEPNLNSFKLQQTEKSNSQKRKREPLEGKPHYNLCDGTYVRLQGTSSSADLVQILEPPAKQQRGRRGPMEKSAKTRILFELMLVSKHVRAALKESSQWPIVLKVLKKIKWEELKRTQSDVVIVRLEKVEKTPSIEKVVQWVPFRQDYYTGNFDVKAFHGQLPRRCVCKMEQGAQYVVSYVLPCGKIVPPEYFFNMLQLKFERIDNLAERNVQRKRGGTETKLSKVMLKPAEKTKHKLIKPGSKNYVELLYDPSLAIVFSKADSDLTQSDVKKLKSMRYTMPKANQCRLNHIRVTIVDKLSGKVLPNVRFEMVDKMRTYSSGVEADNIYSPPNMLYVRVQNSRQWRELKTDKFVEYVERLPVPAYEDDGLYTELCKDETVQKYVQDEEILRLLQVDEEFKKDLLEQIEQGLAPLSRGNSYPVALESRGCGDIYLDSIISCNS